MAVEEVDMAVPVARAWRTGSGDGDAPPSAMAAELRAAARARRRLTLSVRQRIRQEGEFEGATKRLAKRLSADLASYVPERRAAEALRIRAYTELMAMLQVMREDRLRESVRAGAMWRWGVAAGILLCAAITAGAFAADWVAAG